MTSHTYPDPAANAAQNSPASATQQTVNNDNLIRFLDTLKDVRDLDAARAMATKVFLDPAHGNKNRFIAMGASAHPFFVPKIEAESQAKALINADAWCMSVAMARTVAANTKPLRIMLTSAPKSGSTFLSYKLSAAFKLPLVGLTIPSALPFAHSVLGAATKEQDIDELALLMACFSPAGFISHRHTVCTPYLAKQLRLYNILPIMTYRNIFDTFVSYDEHFLKVMREQENSYFRTGLPKFWQDLEFNDRIDILLDSWLGWFMKYYVSWTKCEQDGLIKPIRISYDKDFSGDKFRLAEMLCERFGRPEQDVSVLAAALTEKKTNTLNVNVGLTGRGEKIVGSNRTRIIDYFHKYRDLADFSDLIGEA